MTKRNVQTLLPEFLQNSDTLRKFFKSTVNHWFHSEESRKVSNYIGRIPSYYDPENDFYHVEPTSERQFYQLEPAMVSKNADNEIVQALSYPDLINHLRFQGALTDNHSRLFTQEYYSWAPPIDIDMFMNFSNYYWYPEGPTTIEIKGNASNLIDVDNEILGQVSYISPNAIKLSNGMKIKIDSTHLVGSSSEYADKTYIVEGVGTGIILVDTDDLDSDQVPLEFESDKKEYITIARGAKNKNPWSRNNHWYHKDILSFSQNGSPLLVESEEAVLWDADPWDSTPWDSSITVLTPSFNLDSERQARRPIIQFERNLELYNYGQENTRKVNFVEKDRNDIFTQIQNAPINSIQIDGVNITDGSTFLVISDKNPGVNNRIYKVNELEVTPGDVRYQLILDKNGSSFDGSPVKGEKLIVLDGDSAGKEYWFDGNNYVLSQRRIERNQQPLFNLYDSEGTSLSSYKDSTFIGNKIFSYQKDLSIDGIIDSELEFGISYKNFTQISEIVFENYIETVTYSYEDEPLSRKPITGYYYYNNDGKLGNGWNLSPVKSVQNLDDGFFEIPRNLQANPNFEEITETTRSELLNHFKSIILNQEDITGPVFTQTNYRDTKKDNSLGEEILQHKAPLLKLMLLASSEDLDFMNAVRYSSREYRRFRNKFLKKIETFISQNYDSSIPYHQWLEDAVRMINTTKINQSFPFKDSRTAPVTENYDSATYIAGSGQTEFDLPNGKTFDTECISTDDAVLVYVNDNLLIFNFDYTIQNQNQVALTNAMSGNEKVEVRYYSDVKQNFIPPTASVLGITPVYKPEFFVDSTYSDPRKVLRCHDGSYVVCFNDERDEVLFELEKRIFNTIPCKFKEEKRYRLDPRSVIPGKFRNTGYSFADYVEVLTPIYTKWATSAGINWSENSTYDPTDWKTWNWDGLDRDGENIPGNWRGIYFYYYDTDAPNKRPWEMLGFSIKPTWWENEYGTDYSSNNVEMWSDFENGFIRHGERKGENKLYKRKGLLSILPVDSNGNLKSPSDIGIIKEPGIESKQKDWIPGDMSPQETAFWRSQEYSFFMAQLLYLMRPAEFIEMNWDTEGIEFSKADPTQLINTRFGYRPSNDELHVSFEESNGLVLRTGVQEWIANYLEYLNKDIKTSFGDILRQTKANLAWKNAGFIKKKGLRFLADSYSPGSISNAQKVFIQDEDVNVSFYDTKSIKETFLGGVVVEWTGSNYTVYGYDARYPYFQTIPSEVNNRFVGVTVGSTTVKQYKDAQLDIIEEIPYGFEFTSKQDVFDFLISYGRYLESQGWIFEDFDPTSNEILNWRYSGKQFLFWSEDDLETGAFITLSPFAFKAKFRSEQGFVNDIEEIIQGSYSLLDRSGQTIKPTDVKTIREDDTIEVSPTNEQGLYSVRLSVSEFETITVFDNVTRFGDIIYIPLLNLRQARLKAFGTLSGDWNGRLDIPGYILDQNTANDLIPNFEKTAADFKRYNSIENPSEDDDITDVARHTIGYQRRNYLDRLLIDRDTQYQFYQGMIHQKGSPNAYDRLFRSNSIVTDNNVRFLEEWAFRTGMYGASDGKPPFEFKLFSKDIKLDSQIIRFTSGNQNDIRNDNIVDILPNDTRWVQKSIINVGKDDERWVDRPDVLEFSLRDKKVFKKDLPNAGYVKFGETDFLAVNPTELVDRSKPVFNSEDGQTVWIAIDKDNILGRVFSWDVLRFEKNDTLNILSSDEDNNILISYKRYEFTYTGSPTFTITDSDYSLSEGILVVINNELIQDSSYNISNQDVTINQSLTNEDKIEIYTLANHGLEKNKIISVYDDENRENGVVSNVINDTKFEIDSELNIFQSSFSFGSLGVWNTRRFDHESSISNFNPDLTKDQYFYFDNSLEGDGWVVLKSNGIEFKTERVEPQLVDTSLIDSGLIYDEDKNRTKKQLTVFDPFKGYIPGIADAEIFYKLDYDPARYTNGPEVRDTSLSWNDEQIGRVWWDLSTVRYPFYELGDLQYRYRNWGKIFPGTSINVYEWVRSPVPPTEWNDYVQEQRDQYNFNVGGTVKDINAVEGPSWVERIERSKSGTAKTFYYFWVENKDTVPNLPFRSVPLTDIIDLIENPLSEGLSFISPIGKDSLIVSNIDSVLNDNTVLQVRYNNLCCDVPLHFQWELLREDDNFSVIKDIHWNKMRDSLVGYDDLGKEVPDIRLKGKARLGHFYRPRQTWFENKLKAREVFLNYVNNVLSNIDLVNKNPNFDKNLNLSDELKVSPNEVTGTMNNPTVTTGYQISINGQIIIFSGINGFTGIADELNAVLNDFRIKAEIVYFGTDARIKLIHDFGQDLNILNVVGNPTAEIGFVEGNNEGSGPKYIVQNAQEKANLTGVNIGEKIYVESDEDYFGYWTYWEYNGQDYDLLQIQSYRTNLYWNYKNWYAEGYGPDTKVTVYTNTLLDRNKLSVVPGTLVKVINDGSGKWIWSRYEVDGTWTTIAKEDATIEFLDTLYDSSKFGFDVDVFDSMPFDEIPNVEFRNIIDSLRNDIFIDDMRIEQNRLFFEMLNYVHTEQEMIDWAFKTSYLYIIGFTEDLKKKPLFLNDGFESVIEYVQEVKPYRTKIKDIIRTFATVVDESEWKVIDYDRPPYLENSKTRILDSQDSNDQFILTQNEPWSFWYDEYRKDDRPVLPRANNVRKIVTTIKLDSISAVKNDYVPSLRFTDHPDYPDYWAPSPFFKTDLIDSTNSRDNPEWKLLVNFDGTFTPRNNLARIRSNMINDRIRVVVNGSFANSSTLVLQRSKDPDFSSDVITLLEITEPTDEYIDWKQITTSFDDYPYVRVDTTGFSAGDSVSVTISALYESALTRVLNYYTPGIGQPQLSEIINAYYLGTVVDGFLINFQEGWDNSPWDFAGWDADPTNFDDYIDSKISGGAFYTYEGDNTTNTYNMPPYGTGLLPWSVFVSDLTNDPLTPTQLTDGVHYDIDTTNNDLILLPGAFSWLDGSNNLAINWAITIVDATYSTEQAIQTIVEGKSFTQPHHEGWPSELVPLKVNDSSVMTVVTSGNLVFNLLSNNLNSITDTGWDETPWDYIPWDAGTNINDSAVTFGNATPLLFTFSGISGDTVLLEGSNSGAFTGEEVTITSVTSDTSIQIPDPFNNYQNYTYYRARISVFGSGDVTVTGQVNYAPRAKKGIITYSPTNGLGPYVLDFDIQDSDDIRVYVQDPTNGYGSIIDGSYYTIDVANNTITLDSSAISTFSITSGDIIGFIIWDRTGIPDTNPTWASATYTGSALDLNSDFGITPSPTEPVEGSILVYRKNQSSDQLERLRPPVMSYHKANGTKDTFTVHEMLETDFIVNKANVDVWIENILQTQNTDYEVLPAGYESPEISINNSAPGGGYLVGDNLSLSGGTGLATQFEISAIKPINNQDETNYVGRFTPGSGYNIGDLIYFKDGTVVTVDSVTGGGVIAQFTVDSTNSTGLSQNSALLEQVTTDGLGNGFEIILDTPNEEVYGIRITSKGFYSVQPGSPNSPTGGSGSGLQVTVSNWSQVSSKIKFIENGTSEGYLSDVTVNQGGSGYTISDILTVQGGTRSEIAELRVKELRPINGQTEANYNNTGGNGTFTPGSGYNVSDVVVLDDGSSVTVNSVNGSGGVTSFTVNNHYSFGILFNNQTIDQVNNLDDGPFAISYGASFKSLFNGTGFSLTLGPNNEEIYKVQIVEEGIYTVTPANPVSVTGGTGSGATFYLDFIFPPQLGSDISVRYYGNHYDYSISGTTITLQNVQNNDEIHIMSFENNNLPVGIQTKIFRIFENTSVLDNFRDGTLETYYIDGYIPNNDYILFDYVNENSSITNGVTYTSEPTITIGAGWDVEGWDSDNGGYDNHYGSTVTINQSNSLSLSNNDGYMIITYFTGEPILPTLTYRTFIGYDDTPDNIVKEAVRFSNDKKTFVTSDVLPDANIINLDNAYFLPASNGVVWINGERIEYLQKTGGMNLGDSGSITGLVRGSKGTRKNYIHRIGDDVYDGSSQTRIPGDFEKIYNDLGRRLQISSNVQADFINRETGGYKTYT